MTLDLTGPNTWPHPLHPIGCNPCQGFSIPSWLANESTALSVRPAPCPAASWCERSGDGTGRDRTTWDMTIRDVYCVRPVGQSANPLWDRSCVEGDLRQSVRMHYGSGSWPLTSCCTRSEMPRECSVNKPCVLFQHAGWTTTLDLQIKLWNVRIFPFFYCTILSFFFLLYDFIVFCIVLYSIVFTMLSWEEWTK